jgi:hypothetical protein
VKISLISVISGKILGCGFQFRRFWQSWQFWQ